MSFGSSAVFVLIKFGWSFGKPSQSRWNISFSVFSISALTCKHHPPPPTLQYFSYNIFPTTHHTREQSKNNMFPFLKFMISDLYLCLHDQGHFCGRRKGVHEECLCETARETLSPCSLSQHSYGSLQSAENMNYHLDEANERLKMRRSDI